MAEHPIIKKVITVNIVFDEEQLDQICGAIKSAASWSQLDIGLHEKTPGMKELTDAIRDIVINQEKAE